ncbi:hypothetical protein COCMIDRAFT_109790 [Bipolaris oryzae ATCC 44560]|uniref:Uncharacterized protein n=1 Tax=Bipolaris oryzae ATCC 44560 TaxID=930090 RepID=W6Z8M2_COCMI|nr:uncharacterized protein COCMIDRAFT_109790 [Bipolaris oryzae ATCC 44560]EUC40041.1 hypothetical protein COCMIDRAFT_109790 [Bipolaris oryzae ATCC 44560]
MSWLQSILPIRRRNKTAKSAIVKTPKITRCAHDPKRGNSNVASLALLPDGVSKGRKRDARTHQPLHAKIVEKHCFWLAITMLAVLPTCVTTQRCHENTNGNGNGNGNGSASLSISSEFHDVAKIFAGPVSHSSHILMYACKYVFVVV